MAYTVVGEVVRRPPPPHVAFPDQGSQPVEITLVRDGCYGTCPGYQVSIAGDGTVTYVGDGYVAFSGKHVSHVAPDEVAELVQAFRAADFFSLYASYSFPVTDNATYRLTITVGGRTKSVEDYVGVPAGMPKSVVDLEDAVDRLADTERWVTGNERTLDALKAEGYDFKSPEATRDLATAAETAPDAVVLGLLTAGARPRRADAKPISGDSESLWPAAAIEGAAGRGRVLVVKALVAHGALADERVKLRALSAAVNSARVEVVEEILLSHPPLNVPPHNRMHDARTALSKAADADLEDDANPAVGHMRAQCVQALLAAGANPKLRDEDGGTALHHANDPEVARLLIAAGADVNARDADGKTPLLSTVDEDVAKALIAAGADPGARAKDGTGLEDSIQQWKWTSLKAPPAAVTKP